MQPAALAGFALLLAASAPAPKSGRLTVVLRDNDTLKPTCGRVRVTAGGRDRGPPGKGGWFAVDGKVSLKLPAGGCRLRVDGGRRRLPYDKAIGIAAGSSTRRTIYLVRPRYLDFERAGWLAADPLFSAGARPPDAAVLAARAVGVGALGLQRPGRRRQKKPGRSVPVFRWRLDADPRLGARCHLHSPRRPRRSARPSAPLAGPVSFSFYADAGRPRRFNPWRSAVPWRPELAPFYGLLTSRPLANRGFAARMYFELAAGAPVGGFELDGSESAEKMWFALLRAGYRVPAVAGSRGILSAGRWPQPRMLVKAITERPGAGVVLAAMRAGMSSVSFGPFCFLSVDGRGPGSELPTVEADRRLSVTAMASTDRRAEISRVEIYRGGELFKRFKVPSGRTAFRAKIILRQEEPTWLVAKCWQRIRPEAGGSTSKPPPEAAAITNPIWIEPGTYSTRPRPVVTKLKCRIVDAETGAPVGKALVSGFDRVGASGISGLVGERFASVWECPKGSFEATLPPQSILQFRAHGYESQRIEVFEALGLTDFAKKHAAMKPARALKRLSDPAALELLCARMRHCELTVRLQRSR